MSYVISIHRPGDPRQTVVSDSSKVILCLVTPRFEDSSLVVRAQSAIAAQDIIDLDGINLSLCTYLSEIEQRAQLKVSLWNFVMMKMVIKVDMDFHQRYVL